MTPTIEEVKRVAIERGISAEVRYEQIEELQAFAQHWIEVGRELERSDLAKEFKSEVAMKVIG